LPQELYGGPVVGAITSAFSRLFTTYVQRIGFTCGMRDLLLTDSHEKARAAALAMAEGAAVQAGAELASLKLPEACTAAPLGSELLRAAECRVRLALRPRFRQNATIHTLHDQRCSSALNACASAVTKACFPGGLARKFQQNCMSLMTTTGAKGGLVNFSQISAMLGQQDLEGRRVPRMASGSTLPSFLAFDAGARSCGFVADRFLTGMFKSKPGQCRVS
jgi:DNA-directed RNA polymerase I subunit RPA1